jgi:hypothetical protein
MDAAGGGGMATFDGKEGLGHGHHDLGGVEVGDLAVAADNLNLAWGNDIDRGLRRSHVG